MDGQGLYPLLVIEAPDVQPPRFQIDGTIGHEDVAGVAFVEMWTVLPDESRYFIRTLADSGPLSYMTGSSEPRPFSLPFELGEGGPVPIRLEINLVTEGSGRFWVGPLTIVSTGAQPAASPRLSTTTIPADAGTTVASPTNPEATDTPEDPNEVGGTGLWWSIGALMVVGASIVGWLYVVRRRRAEEQRRMSAMDSLRS